MPESCRAAIICRISERSMVRPHHARTGGGEIGRRSQPIVASAIGARQNLQLQSLRCGIKRKHRVDQIIAALLKAEIAEKHARSIRYQMGVAKLPLAKELADFVFKGTPINEQLVRDLAGGIFLSQQR